MDKSSKYTANKYGLNTPPCLNPLVTWNGSDKCLPHLICIVCSLYQCFSGRTKHIGTFFWINFLNNFMCNTRSNAFEASKKPYALMNHGLCSMKQFASTEMYIDQYHVQPWKERCLIIWSVQVALALLWQLPQFDVSHIPILVFAYGNYFCCV